MFSDVDIFDLPEPCDVVLLKRLKASDHVILEALCEISECVSAINALCYCMLLLKKCALLLMFRCVHAISSAIDLVNCS